MHNIELACWRNGIGQPNAVGEQLPIDEDGDVPSQAVLIVKNVAPQLPVVGQSDVERLTDGLSRHGGRATGGEFLQVIGEVDGSHGMGSIARRD